MSASAQITEYPQLPRIDVHAHLGGDVEMIGRYLKIRKTLQEKHEVDLAMWIDLGGSKAPDCDLEEVDRASQGDHTDLCARAVLLQDGLFRDAQHQRAIGLCRGGELSLLRRQSPSESPRVAGQLGLTVAAQVVEILHVEQHTGLRRVPADRAHVSRSHLFSAEYHHVIGPAALAQMLLNGLLSLSQRHVHAKGRQTVGIRL